VHEVAIPPPWTPGERTSQQSAAYRIEEEDQENEGSQLPVYPFDENDDETMLLYGLFAPVHVTVSPELHGMDRNRFLNRRKELLFMLVPQGQPQQRAGVEIRGQPMRRSASMPDRIVINSGGWPVVYTGVMRHRKQHATVAW